MNKAFEEAIKAYLDQRANEDEQFAISYAKENKSIEECCRYIIGEVFKQREGNEQVVGMSDAEVYGLAVHYYDEDDIKVESTGYDAEVHHSEATYEPTEEDKENAKKAALARLEDEAYRKLYQPKKRTRQAKDEPTEAKQTTLFDMI